MIYVICCNDSLEEATTNKAKAERRMKAMQRDHYEIAKRQGYYSSFETYCHQVYWHIHYVKEVD